jgi:hypothetical protein
MVTNLSRNPVHNCTSNSDLVRSSASHQNVRNAHVTSLGNKYELM